jgi:hypothetical protein
MATSKSILQYVKMVSASSKVNADGTIEPGVQRDYFFQSSDVYQGEIGRRLGMTIIPFDKYEGSEPLIQVKQLVSCGKMIKLTVEVAATDSIKYYHVWCERSKVGDILGDNPSKNLHDQDFKVKGKTVGKVLRVRSANRDTFN